MKVIKSKKILYLLFKQEWCPYDFYSSLNKNKKLEIKCELSDITKSIAESLEGSRVGAAETTTPLVRSSRSAYNISSSTTTTFEFSPLASSACSSTSIFSECKESFICIDQNGLMYSFSVEANHIKDAGIALPEDGLMANVTCMSLKKDYIIFGDQEGNVHRWNYLNKLSKTVALKRGGEIRKVNKSC